MAIGAALFAGGGSAYASDTVTLTDENLLILRLRTDRYVLSEGVIGYQTPGGACVLLDDLVAGLEFEITSHDTGARGWFIQESSEFELDIPARRVRADDIDYVINDGDIYDDAGAHCVALSAAENWFSLSLKIDMPNASIVADSARPLPVEERAARAKRRAALTPRKAAAPGTVVPIQPEYKLARWPTIDTSAFANISDEETVAGGDFVLAGDFLRASAELYGSFDSNRGVETLRGVIGRRSAAGDIGGPLALTTALAGDIATPQTRLSAETRLGRGFVVSSFPIDQPDVFDSTSFRGDLQNGWEVELYRNGALLDFRAANADGRYEFLEVPVVFGRNEFRLVFYGPQGQRREKVEEIFVGESALSKGQSRLYLAVNQQDKSLFIDSTATPDDDDGAARITGKYEIGVTDSLALGVGAASYSLNGERETYIDASLSARAGGAAIYGDISYKVGGGVAASGSVQTNVAGINLIAAHEEYFSYESELAPGRGDNALRRKDEVRADFVLNPFKGFAMPVAILARREEFESGGRNFSGAARVSAPMGPIAFSNEITLNRIRRDRFSQTTASGVALANYYTGFGSIRGGIEYDLAPEWRFARSTATMDIPLNERAGARINAVYDMRADTGQFSAGLNYGFKNVSVGAFARVDTEGAFETGFTLSASFTKKPGKKRWAAHAKSAARSGVIATRVFIDEDYDRKYSAGEEIIEDAAVKIDGRRQLDEEGASRDLIIGIAPYQPASIEVDMSTVDDPYLLGPKNAEIVVSARPGVVAEIDIPLTRSGEIAGVVSLETDEGLREVADVKLELVDPNGNVAAWTTSEFDGFFLFERIPFGSYEVVLSGEQASRLNIELPENVSVSLSVEKDVIDGLPVTLRDTSERSSL